MSEEPEPVEMGKNPSVPSLVILLGSGLVTLGLFWLFDLWLNAFALPVLVCAGASLAYVAFLGISSALRAVMSGVHAGR